MIQQLQECDNISLRMEDEDGNVYRAAVDDVNIEIDRTLLDRLTVASIDGTIDVQMRGFHETTDTEY